MIYFLGDADTALNFEFSREAVKLTKALPPGAVLKLPRIPIGMPNGIDDCREKLRSDFPAFWERITAESITVEPKLPAAALAVKLATRELRAIAGLENSEIQIAKLCETASYLDPLSLETLAGAVQENLGRPLSGTPPSKSPMNARRLPPSNNENSKPPPMWRKSLMTRAPKSKSRRVAPGSPANLLTSWAVL